ESAGATAIKNTNGMNTHAFSDAVSSPAESACDVRAMPVTIVAALPVADKIRGDGSASAEILVGGANARVDDVSVDARASKVIRVGTVQREVSLVYAIKTPRRGVELGVRNGDFPILHHVLDARVVAEGLGGTLRQTNREALESALVSE